MSAGKVARGLRERLSEPVDIASVVMVRVFFGLLMVWEVVRYFENDWIRKYWLAPDLHFRYFGFDWVAPWPGEGMYWHFLGLGLLALLVTFGLFYRVAAALFFVGFSYVFLLEQARYLNHFYLVCLVSFLMAVIRLHEIVAGADNGDPAGHASSICPLSGRPVADGRDQGCLGPCRCQGVLERSAAPALAGPHCQPLAGTPLDLAKAVDHALGSASP